MLTKRKIGAACVALSTILAGASARAQPASRPAIDDEEQQIARELQQIRARDHGNESPLARPRPAGPAPAAGVASARGLSNTFNPAISGTVTLLAGGSSRSGSSGTDAEAETDDLRSGPMLQEVEIRLSATVDPYFRADITLAGNLEGVAFEEAYLTTLSIPRVNIRAGQLLANFGRHNLLHTHAFAFVTAPLPWRALIGPEGLRDVGISADVLLPLPFFAEINLQTFRGQWRALEGSVADDPATAVDESVPDRRRDEDLAYLGHLKTLFELGASTTIELGGTYVGGRNGFGKLSSIVGADLTVTWRPIEAERYTGLRWTSEYLWVDRRGAPTDRRVGGAYTSLRYQFGQRWWVQGRGALLGAPAGAAGRTWRGEALVALIPSELSALRLQYAIEAAEDGGVDPVHEVFLQAVVSVGSHPAHAY